jgi:hypothetical protein
MAKTFWSFSLPDIAVIAPMVTTILVSLFFSQVVEKLRALKKMCGIHTVL